MTTEFNIFSSVVAITALFFIGYIAAKLRRREPLFLDLNYRQDEVGNLIIPKGWFNTAARTLHLDNQPKPIPFDRIRGVYLHGTGSRRIGIGVILDNDQTVLLSHMLDNDMSQAAHNAELVCAIVANQGSAFREAFRDAEWLDILKGQVFEFYFEAINVA